LAVLLWTDFSPALVPLLTDSEEIAAVKSELLRRISYAGVACDAEVPK
jgi:hypothetical protein